MPDQKSKFLLPNQMGGVRPSFTSTITQEKTESQLASSGLGSSLMPVEEDPNPRGSSTGHRTTDNRLTVKRESSMNFKDIDEIL